MASLIGTSLEWYDFFLYSTAAAVVFNKLFFPTFDPLMGTLLAFITAAVGFAVRPRPGGWRIGFILSGALVLIGLWVRRPGRSPSSRCWPLARPD